MRTYMDYYFTGLWFAVYLIFSFPLMSYAQAQSSTETKVTIEQVLAEVQIGLAKAQTEMADLNMPPLKSVTLTLQTLLTRAGGPKLKLLVFSFGQTWEKEQSQEMILELTPPRPYTPFDIATEAKLSVQLVEAIISAAQGVQAARTGKPPLWLNRMEAEFTFVIKTQTTGSLAVNVEIVPVSAELSGDLQKKALHKMKIAFERPQN